MFVKNVPPLVASTLIRQQNICTARKPNLLGSVRRKQRFSSGVKQPFRILGIETSCDDTGVAVIDSDRNVLGEALFNQSEFHLHNGGILPPIAGMLHRQNMELVADQALDAAGMSMADIDAVAATVKPGMRLSLEVGVKYGIHLCRQWRKPFIPIHHMEAHALTARLTDERVEFPFLALLVSGGHCLIALAEHVDSFLLLGSTRDDPPGEFLDKFARRMKLQNIPEYRTFSGGKAVESMATKATDPKEFPFSVPMTQEHDCDFSFAGMKNKVFRYIETEEKKYGTVADGIIDSASNLCAAAQTTMTRHLCHRVERAMTFLQREKMIPEENRSLVVSGGVACNQFLAQALKVICDAHGYHLSIPPPKYCNDNGVMIAWNGVERYRESVGLLSWNELDSVDIQTRSPFGKDIRDSVKKASIKIEWTKLKDLV